jgi:hypothetical protein
MNRFFKQQFNKLIIIVFLLGAMGLGDAAFRNLQVISLNGLLDFGRLGRVIENEAINGSAAYTMLELFDDIRKGLWAELKNGKAIDIHRRSLQRAHIERLEVLLTEDEPEIPIASRSRMGPQINASQSDIRPIVRAELKTLQGQIKAAIPMASEKLSKIHLEDILERVDLILDPKKG